VVEYCKGAGVILVEDETRVQREANVKRVWYSKGKQPEVRVEQKREGKSYYGALNVTTGTCHLMEFERQVSRNTVQFLKGLEKAYKGKKVLLLWDGAPWHRGEVKKYLKHRVFSTVLAKTQSTRASMEGGKTAYLSQQ
jgi:hypothetical protein